MKKNSMVSAPHLPLRGRLSGGYAMNSNVKILIADDEERWRRLVGDFLRNEGYKVVEAADGQEAVDLVKATVTSPWRSWTL